LQHSREIKHGFAEDKRQILEFKATVVPWICRIRRRSPDLLRHWLKTGCARIGEDFTWPGKYLVYQRKKNYQRIAVPVSARYLIPVCCRLHGLGDSVLTLTVENPQQMSYRHHKVHA
jgi:hypothetical protein